MDCLEDHTWSGRSSLREGPFAAAQSVMGNVAAESFTGSNSAREAKKVLGAFWINNLMYLSWDITFVVSAQTAVTASNYASRYHCKGIIY